MSESNQSGRPQGPELGTGQLLALAATASGGIAWLIQRAVGRSDEAPAAAGRVNLRGPLHALAESEPVRAIERRGNELAPVVDDYRGRAARAAERASRESAKRLSEAERVVARRRKESARALHGLERQVNRQVDRTRHLVDEVPGRLSAVVDDGRKELRHLEQAAGQRAGDLRQATTIRTGEATTMANERVRRLQERSLEAAGAISATLRDGSKDTTVRVNDVRDQVVSLAKTSSKDVGALINDVREDARKNLPDVAKAVSLRASDLGHQVADGASRAGQAIGDRASSPGGVSDAAGRAQSTVVDLTQKAAAVAGPTLGKLGERIGHLSEDIREDPTAVRARLTEQGQGLVRSAQDQASRTVRDLVPLSGQGSAIDQERAKEGRDRGLDLTALLQSNIPSFLSQVTDLMEQAGGTSGKRVQDARKQGAKAVGGAEDQLQSTLDRLGEAARRAAQVGDQAVAASSHFRGASRNAAHKTADAGKDGLESVIWLGAAGVAMYYGVLSPEQRDKVSKVGIKVGRGLGKVIGEVRGRDQKF